MEIKHWVETSEDEASYLYMMVVSVATATYPTVEDQNAAILSAMPEFKAALDDLISEAYKLGRMKSKKSKDVTVEFATV
jgi:hypothetical protein